MHLHVISAKGKRRFKVTIESNHELPIAANLLDRAFSVIGYEPATSPTSSPTKAGYFWPW